MSSRQAFLTASCAEREVRQASRIRARAFRFPTGSFGTDLWYSARPSNLRAFLCSEDVVNDLLRRVRTQVVGDHVGTPLATRTGALSVPGHHLLPRPVSRL